MGTVDFDEHVADLGDVALTYRMAGPHDGPRVVYVSGSGSDLRREPNALSSPLPEQLRVLAYDHRGLGRSTTAGQPTMADFATDLLALLDHVGWHRCAAAGISFGGMVLMDAACRAPERFDRLVLGCTSPGGKGGSSYPLHELADLPDEERRERYLDILDQRNVTDPDRRAVVRAVLERMDEAKAASVRTSAYTPGELAQLQARRHHDCWDRLDRLTMPVLVAAGRHDRIAPPANQDAMAARLPDAQLEWFEGGHAFFLEDRTAYPTMVEFLRHSR